MLSALTFIFTVSGLVAIHANVPVTLQGAVDGGSVRLFPGGAGAAGAEYTAWNYTTGEGSRTVAGWAAGWDPSVGRYIGLNGELVITTVSRQSAGGYTAFFRHAPGVAISRVSLTVSNRTARCEPESYVVTRHMSCEERSRAGAPEDMVCTVAYTSGGPELLSGRLTAIRRTTAEHCLLKRGNFTVLEISFSSGTPVVLDRLILDTPKPRCCGSRSVVCRGLKVDNRFYRTECGDQFNSTPEFYRCLEQCPNDTDTCPPVDVDHGITVAAGCQLCFQWGLTPLLPPLHRRTTTTTTTTTTSPAPLTAAAVAAIAAPRMVVGMDDFDKTATVVIVTPGLAIVGLSLCIACVGSVCRCAIRRHQLTVECNCRPETPKEKPPPYTGPTCHCVLQPFPLDESKTPLATPPDGV